MSPPRWTVNTPQRSGRRGQQACAHQHGPAHQRRGLPDRKRGQVPRTLDGEGPNPRGGRGSQRFGWRLRRSLRPNIRRGAHLRALKLAAGQGVSACEETRRRCWNVPGFPYWCHFDEKRPGFFDVNVPAERPGVEDRREEDWRKPFPLPLLGTTSANEELTALVGFNPQREDWRRPFLVYLMGPGVGDESIFEAEHADRVEVEAVLGFRPTHAVNVSAGCSREIDHVATALMTAVVPAAAWSGACGSTPRPSASARPMAMTTADPGACRCRPAPVPPSTDRELCHPQPRERLPPHPLARKTPAIPGRRSAQGLVRHPFGPVAKVSYGCVPLRSGRARRHTALGCRRVSWQRRASRR